MLPTSNPFATRWIRPGSIRYRFPPGETAARLVDKLARAHWQGQIVGPHGAGKSTLVQTLLPEIAAAGRTPVVIHLRDGQRRLPHYAWQNVTRDTLLIVDGYEQLGWWSRRGLRRRAARVGCGLLVTAHADAGLPTLCEVRGDLTMAVELAKLLQADCPELVQAADVAACFEQHAGNLRETLFALYDLYEQRRRASD